MSRPLWMMTDCRYVRVHRSFQTVRERESCLPELTKGIKIHVALPRLQERREEDLEELEDWGKPWRAS